MQPNGRSKFEVPPLLYDHTIENHFELGFTPSPAEASEARQAARRFLDEAKTPKTVAADLEVVVSELITNAVEQHPLDAIRLTITVTDQGVQLTVANRRAPSSDDNPWPPQAQADETAATRPAKGELRERGWGLEIVEALTDNLDYTVVDGWTEVTGYRRLDSQLT